MGKFPGYGRAGIKFVYIPVEIQGMEIFQNMEFLGYGDFPAYGKFQGVYRKTMGLRKYLYRQVYKLHTYVLQ